MKNNTVVTTLAELLVFRALGLGVRGLQKNIHAFIIELKVAAVHKAMQRFDLEMRDTAEWHDWEQKNTHKFAFVRDGRRYPMKELISLATGTPKADFSGLLALEIWRSARQATS
jgi:hypothetical protein